MSDDNPKTKSYDCVKDVPTDVLASRFVGSLILCKGNLNKYKELTAYMIRELRGEPHPVKMADFHEIHKNEIDRARANAKDKEVFHIVLREPLQAVSAFERYAGADAVVNYVRLIRTRDGFSVLDAIDQRTIDDWRQRHSKTPAADFAMPVEMSSPTSDERP